MIENILFVVDVALLIWFGTICFRMQRLMKKADKLIEEMREEIEGSGEDGA